MEQTWEKTNCRNEEDNIWSFLVVWNEREVYDVWQNMNMTKIKNDCE